MIVVVGGHQDLAHKIQCQVVGGHQDLAHKIQCQVPRCTYQTTCRYTCLTTHFFLSDTHRTTGTEHGRRLPCSAKTIAISREEPAQASPMAHYPGQFT